MKFVSQNVEYVDINQIDKKLEFCGRVCYNSQDKIKDNSYEIFLNSIIKRGHTSVLEHSELTVFYPIKNYKQLKNVFEFPLEKQSILKFIKIIKIDKQGYLVSANIRAWLDFYHNFLEIERDFSSIKNEKSFYDFIVLLKILREHSFAIQADTYQASIPKRTKQDYLQIVNEDYVHKENMSFDVWHAYVKYCKIYTFKLTTNRAITHELVRHRLLGISQMSTRYISYNTEKYNKELTFCIEDSALAADGDARATLENTLKSTETTYMYLIDRNFKPDNARAMLPNCTMATIVLSGTADYWETLFKLRCDKHAHFEIRKLAENIREEIHRIESEEMLKVRDLAN